MTVRCASLLAFHLYLAQVCFGDVRVVQEHAAELLIGSSYFRRIAAAGKCPGLSDVSVSEVGVAYKVVRRCDPDSVSMLVALVRIGTGTGVIEDMTDGTLLVADPAEMRRLEVEAAAFLMPLNIARLVVISHLGATLPSFSSRCQVRSEDIGDKKSEFVFQVNCGAESGPRIRISRINGRIHATDSAAIGARESRIVRLWSQLRLGVRLAEEELVAIGTAHAAYTGCSARRDSSLDMGSLRFFQMVACANPSFSDTFYVSARDGHVYESQSLRVAWTHAGSAISRAVQEASRRHRARKEEFVLLTEIEY